MIHQASREATATDRLRAELCSTGGRHRREQVIRNLLRACAGLSILISFLIVLSLSREAWTFVSQVEWARLVDDGWFPRRGIYDVRTLLAGSVIVAGIAMVVAAPLGLGAAIFLAEYAPPRLRRTLKPLLEVLAGIPSVVLGFFALTWISPEIVQRLRPDSPQFTLMAAGIGVGILTIPLIASIAEDAMRAVPAVLREASYGLGARKITTTVRVVIPAAVSGLVAAFIVAISRAIGETMVVFIAAGATGGSLFTMDPFESGQTMTAAMAAQAAGTDAVRGAALTFQSLFFVGLLLFLITLSLNVVADRFVRRVRQRY
ncbi:MAG TPA: phosphate ABC transporter permease subunit PstC [Acidimicrobiales bacterium]|nr:phosphate ABC transporter permease subunit PstC [Acidimicrobiales bacterium]